MSRSLPSLSASRALRKLGSDIATARKRRRMKQDRLAEGSGVSVATIRRLEEGDAGVSIGTLAMVLLALGELDRVGSLLDLAADDVGLLLEREALPKRVRGKRATGTGGDTSSPSAGISDDEGF